jgi:hypothetical protein
LLNYELILTPKVLANSSPGLSFGNPGAKVPVSHQTLKGFPTAANPFRVPSVTTHLIPGLPKLNPGLELANTFGVNINSELTKHRIEDLTP